MEIRALTPDFAVSPQINPEDLPGIVAAGYTTVINNRPCPEIPPSHQNDRMKAAAEALGLTFVTLPITSQTLNLDNATAQMEACAQSVGPVLAYCASGTRSTIIWAFGQAGTIDTDTIVHIAATHGYDLRHMRGQLDLIAAR